ncbi:DUF72 domain-containing protein [Deferrisoma sp.]
MSLTPDPSRYVFRGLHPRLHLGTASDRYAGWIGQIYTPGRYEGRIQRRTKRLAGQRFTEEVLPVESVAEYFEHFDLLEIDYTFYAPLLEVDGRPTPTLRVLRRYAEFAPAGAGFVLKAPQMFFAQKLLTGGRYVSNESYLDAEGFRRRFWEPAEGLLGPALRAVVFEQEYQRSRNREPPERVAEGLDRFFSALPPTGRFHVELRTEAYLSAPVLEVLAAHGVGQVLSHWTWLPPLRVQWARGGRRVRSGSGWQILRLMTPRGVRYEEAYARAFPFDRMVEGMMTPGMVEDAVRISREAIERGAEVGVIVNNRAGGNAPEIARRIAEAWLAEGGI